MGFGQTGSKKVWRMFKIHQLGVVMQVKKGGSFDRKGRYSHVILWYCETLLQVLLGKILLDTSFYYTVVLHV